MNDIKQKVMEKLKEEGDMWPDDKFTEKENKIIDLTAQIKDKEWTNDITCSKHQKFKVFCIDCVESKTQKTAKEIKEKLEQKKFCPNCYKEMLKGDHYCESCKERVSIPIRIEDLHLKQFWKELGVKDE